MNDILRRQSQTQMRALILILILALNAQPLQAGGCDMDAGRGGASSAHVMDGNDSPGHDCCDPGGSDSGTSCQDDMNCRSCTAVALLMPDLPRIDADDWPHARYLDIGDSGPLPNHSQPPYRPPIS